jgi:glycosyltransferase involved in cell wall biosynthesis
MGFHGISIGRCYAQKISAEFGMTVDAFKYGCDISHYGRLQGSKRSGVVFYARRETARRGFELGLMALEVFAARRPDIEIHIYGDKMGKLPFAFVDHGHVTPDELNGIYNRCFAGLSLSFTNVSLVALEMIAAGCIPVVNDTIEVRTDLENSFVRYAPPYPQALAAGLEALVMTPDFDSLSQAAAASVRGTTWDDAGASADGIIRRALGSSS